MNLFAAGDMPGADSEPSGIVESAENDAVEYCLGAAISTGEEETFFIKAGEKSSGKADSFHVLPQVRLRPMRHWI